VQVPRQTRRADGITEATGRAGYFCQVRFLWRLARNCFLRLCLLIFALRRFFSDPIVVFYGY
jgi:hypothetical protein